MRKIKAFGYLDIGFDESKKPYYVITFYHPEENGKPISLDVHQGRSEFLEKIEISAIGLGNFIKKEK